jgi:hypothetical protein
MAVALIRVSLNQHYRDTTQRFGRGQQQAQYYRFGEQNNPAKA